MYDDAAEHTADDAKRAVETLEWRWPVAGDLAGLDYDVVARLEPTVVDVLRNVADHLVEWSGRPHQKHALLKRHVQDGTARVTEGRFTQLLESWPDLMRLLRCVTGVAAATGDVVGAVDAALLFSERSVQSESPGRLGHIAGESGTVLGVALVGELGVAVVSARELIEGSRDRRGHPEHDPQRLAGFVAALGPEEVPKTLAGEIVTLMRGERQPTQDQLAAAVERAAGFGQPIDEDALAEQGFPRCLAVGELKIPRKYGSGVDVRRLGDDAALARTLTKLGLDVVIQAMPIPHPDDDTIVDEAAVAELLVCKYDMKDPEITIVDRSEIADINRMSRLIAPYGVGVRSTMVRCWYARERTDPSAVAFAGRFERGSTNHHLFRVSPRLLVDLASRARLFGVVQLLVTEGPTSRLVGSDLRLLQPLHTGGRPPRAHRLLMQALTTAHALLLAARRESGNVAA